MSEHEDGDEALDLSAWQAPAAPDVTDAVLARMRGASAAVEPPAPRARRWLLGGAVLAIAAATGATALLLRSSSPATPDAGEVVATAAQHLALDGASADVDPGATLRWTHDRDGLLVEQRGGATWTVGDRLRIDTGAGSIEATAANLRVEVEMNRQDLHVIATSAITAATVALVTIVVYDGRVRATSAGQTITLEPGTTFQIVPDHPPHPADLVGAAPPSPPPVPPAPPAPPPVPPVPPAPPIPSAEGDRMRTQCLELQAKKQWVELHTCAETLATLDPVRGKELAAIASGELRNETALGHLATAIRAGDLAAAYASYSIIPLSSVYAATAMTRYAPFEAAAIEKLVITARDLANHKKCAEVEALAVSASAPAAASAVRAAGCKRDPFATRDGGGSPAPTCDAAALVASGEQSYAIGAYGDALVAFEAANLCHPESKTLARAFVAACRAAKEAKAIELYHALPATLQTTAAYLQMCIANGIDPRNAPPAITTGTLEIRSAPAARVALDGRETGKTTPATFSDVPPGKHKITLQVGEDRFTFAVTVEPGKTATLSKQLQ